MKMEVLGISGNYFGEGNLGEDFLPMGNEIRNKRRGRKRKGTPEQIIFEGRNSLSGVLRTFGHINPEFFVEDTKTATQKALEQIGATFGPRKVDENITEVSSLLPDTFDITLGELHISKAYPEREVGVNGFRFRVWQEGTNNGNHGGQIPVCKIQPIFGENTTFLLPDELEYIDDTKNMLNNRARKVFSHASQKQISIENEEALKDWISEAFGEYKGLSLGHTFTSLAQDTLLRRNYGFLVWFLLHYNKSLQK